MVWKDAVTRSIMQDDVQERAMYLDVSVVFNKSQVPEFVHERVDAATCRSDHLGQSFLADLGNDELRFARLAELRQQQKDAGQTFFARIEQLIGEVLFDPDVPLQQKRHEYL